MSSKQKKRSKHTDGKDESAAKVNNSKAPIFKLPVEMLAQIFLILRDAWPPWRAQVGPSKSLGWLNVTFASRFLRAAALAIPALWTSVDFGLGMRWTRLFLERAGGLPVELFCSKRYCQAPSNTPGRELSKDAAYWKSVKEVQTLESRLQAILLRQLAPNANAVHAPLPLELSFNLLPPKALSNLRHLTLDYTTVCKSPPWTFLPATLHSLALSRSNVSEPRDRRFSRENAAGLAAFLALARDLDTLALGSCFIGALSSCDELTVAASAMRRMNLGGFACEGECMRLLEALPHPERLEQLVLDIWANPDHAESMRTLIRHLSCSVPAEPFTSLACFSSDRSFEIVASRDGDAPDLAHFMAAGRVVNDEQGAHRFAWDQPSLVLSTFAFVEREFVDGVLSSLQLSLIRMLHLSGPYRGWSSLPETVPWFSTMSGIEELHLGGKYTPDILETLELRPGGWVVTDARDLLLPRLKTLVINECDFHQRLGEPARSLERRAKGKKLADVFSRVLARRAKLDGAPRYLVLNECHAHQDDVDAWLAAVPKKSRKWKVKAWTLLDPADSSGASGSSDSD